MVQWYLVLDQKDGIERALKRGDLSKKENSDYVMKILVEALKNARKKTSYFNFNVPEADDLPYYYEFDGDWRGDYLARNKFSGLAKTENGPECVKYWNNIFVSKDYKVIYSATKSALDPCNNRSIM